MALERIPNKVESLLSASVYISNYKKAIEELIYNSLDAESTSIAIRVCIQDNTIQILDNGDGINKNDFKHIGFRYMSSNIESNFISTRKKYGYRGLSLASIIEISQEVKITSRSNGSDNTYIKKFLNSREQNICKTNARPSKGTTVEIKGFLYNLHIQRKSINPLLEMENIKTFLEHLSLVCCSVSFSLRDDSRNEIIFKMHKNRDIFQTLLLLFNINKEDIQELHIEKQQYKIQGFIEKSNIIIRKYHWIYINGRFVTQSKIHKIVNGHFNKLWNQKNIDKTKKNNFKDENEFLNKRIPSYFLFIKCPLNDCDIIYGPEETLVEFKNWLEIDKLIEKLIKFYHGELQVNLVSRKDTYSNSNLNENDKDTRQQVKNIMQKILGNNVKKSKFSQIPNGIKGNQIKRKRKKKSHTALKKVAQDTNVTETRNLSKSCFKGLNTDFAQKEHHNTIQKHLKSARKSNKLSTYKTKKKYMQNEQYRKKDKQISKFSFSHDPVIKKFRDPLTTVKNRCAILCNNVQRLLEQNNHKVYHDKEQDKTVVTSPAYQNNFLNRSITKNYITNYSNISSNAKESIVACDKDIYFKTTYDLIKPIHKSQQQLKNYLDDTQNSHRQLQTSTFINTYTVSNSNLPKLTYESHNYNARRVSKRQVTRHFITTPSCNNFILHNEKHFISSVNKNIKKTKGNRKKFNFNCQNYLKSNANKNINFTVDQSYMIDVSSSRKTGQKYVSHCMDDINLSLSAQPPLNSTHYNYHFNIQSTYNIENLISSPDHDITCTGCDLHKTYTVRSSNCTNQCEQKKLQAPKLVNKSLNASNNNVNFVFVSDPLYSNKSMSRTIDPLNVCETEYRSNEIQDYEKEFEFSFVDKNKKDSLYNYDSESSNKFIQKHDKEISQYFSKDITDNNFTNNEIHNDIYYEHIYDTETRENEIKKPGHKENTGNNNLVFVDINTDNFDLKRRLNIVPKGMSPVMAKDFIANNIQNLEEEYYEDLIYKKFANDIQLYSEVLEPRVQNINDFTTREIQKVSCKINKVNTDWIFDAESLRHAKVVLGQVDCKFIASKVIGKSAKNNKSCEFLVLFDQHAVDERIRLENNLKDYTDGHDWQSITLDPIILKLTKDSVTYLHNYREKFTRFGLLWTFQDGNISINSIPKAILGQNPRDVEVVIKAVKCLISELIEAIKSLKGNVPQYPKCIMSLVFSEACRYAIKFGDKLNKNECHNMLRSLAKCNVPFQCAHGRPVMAVMMEITKSNHNYKINRDAVIRFQTSLK